MFDSLFLLMRPHLKSFSFAHSCLSHKKVPDSHIFLKHKSFFKDIFGCLIIQFNLPIIGWILYNLIQFAKDWQQQHTLFYCMIRAGVSDVGQLHGLRLKVAHSLEVGRNTFCVG